MAVEVRALSSFPHVEPQRARRGHASPEGLKQKPDLNFKCYHLKTPSFSALAEKEKHHPATRCAQPFNLALFL